MKPLLVVPSVCIVALLLASSRPLALSVGEPALAPGSPRSLEEEEEEAEEEEEEEEEDEDEAKPAAKTAKPGAGGTSVAPKDLGLERLLEINSREVFGGKAKIRGDQVEITFTGDGEIKAGFEGTGIIDSKSPEMKGANRRFIRVKEKKSKDEPEQLIPGLCGIGVGEGAWVSRFPLAGSPWVQVGFRIPNLIGAQSTLRMRVNWNKGSGIETSFFQTLSTLSGGKPKSTRTTPLKEFQGQPLDWFPRKGQSVKVEFGIRDGKAIVRMDGKDIVTLPKVADRGGKVALLYSKLLFTLDNLKVTGKLDRAWCEKRIEELKASGKLKTAEDPPPDPLGAPAG